MKNWNCVIKQKQKDIEKMLVINFLNIITLYFNTLSEAVRSLPVVFAKVFNFNILSDPILT